MVLITHDLGVVAGQADRVLVMYAGKPVEIGPIDGIYYHPRMPYTSGLLGSLPRLDQRSQEKLTPIPGTPPSVVNLPPGCPFAPRCPLRTDICLQSEPALLPALGADHEAACHHSDLLTPRARWTSSAPTPMPCRARARTRVAGPRGENGAAQWHPRHARTGTRAGAPDARRVRARCGTSDGWYARTRARCASDQRVCCRAGVPRADTPEPGSSPGAERGSRCLPRPGPGMSRSGHRVRRRAGAFDAWRPAGASDAGGACCRVGVFDPWCRACACRAGGRGRARPSSKPPASASHAPLLTVKNLVKEFPIRSSGLIRKHGRRGAGGVGHLLRHLRRRDPGPGGRVRLRQVHDLACGAASAAGHQRQGGVRRRGPDHRRQERAAPPAPGHAAGVPGPVRLAGPADHGQRDHRRAAADPRPLRRQGGGPPEGQRPDGAPWGSSPSTATATRTSSPAASASASASPGRWRCGRSCWCSTSRCRRWTSPSRPA